MIEKDLRTYIVNDAAAGPLVGTRVHYLAVPQNYAGPYVYFERQGVDNEAAAQLDGNPDQEHGWQETFSVECISEDHQEVRQLTQAIRKFNDRHRLIFGAGTVQHIAVEDADDNHAPHGIGDDEGRDYAVLTLTLTGYEPED